MPRSPPPKACTSSAYSLSYDGWAYAAIGTPNHPYFNGRYSDGLVYSEQLAEATRRTLHNHAFPGATTTDVLINQVMPLVTAHQGNLPGDGLHVYWAGANDLLDLLALPNCNPQFVIGNAMTQTANAISTLSLSGAQDIVVLNLPDLSKTPRVLALNDPRRPRAYRRWQRRTIRPSISRSGNSRPCLPSTSPWSTSLV